MTQTGQRCLTQAAERHEAARIRLEQMLQAPAQHRYERVTLAEIGEKGSGAYEVKPRHGVIGLLAGWWHVRVTAE